LETQLVERVLEAIATNRPCAYGRKEVEQAIEAGAVETLLVSDSVVRDLAVERMMHDAEAARGHVVLVSPHHEAGARLEGLGGVAALLRFPIR
jgi:protein pelota